MVTLLGPAFVAAIAFVEPGYVATNVTTGPLYGYLLVGVIVTANLMILAGTAAAWIVAPNLTLIVLILT